jgi:hypothetical protein
MLWRGRRRGRRGGGGGPACRRRASRPEMRVTERRPRAGERPQSTPVQARGRALRSAPSRSTSRRRTPANDAVSGEVGARRARSEARRPCGRAGTCLRATPRRSTTTPGAPQAACRTRRARCATRRR